MSFETSSRQYFQEIIDTVYTNDWSDWEELEGIDQATAEELADGNNNTIYFMLEDAADVGINIDIRPDGSVEGSLSKSEYMENMGDFFDVDNELTDYSHLSDDSNLYAEFKVEFEEYDQETLSETVAGLKSVGEAYHLFQEPEL